MSNDQLFQQVTFLLQRSLTPDEQKFLTLASQAIRQEKNPQSKMANEKARIDKIAV